MYSSEHEEQPNVVSNTVHVYDRTRTADAHREPFVVTKGRPVANSLPPSFSIPYKDMWPVTIVTPEGERLIISTGTFDALITSSLRLDTTMDASVGGIMPSFLLVSAEHSKAAKIFSDQVSVDVDLKYAGS